MFIEHIIDILEGRTVINYYMYFGERTEIFKADTPS